MLMGKRMYIPNCVGDGLVMVGDQWGGGGKGGGQGGRLGRTLKTSRLGPAILRVGRRRVGIGDADGGREMMRSRIWRLKVEMVR